MIRAGALLGLFLAFLVVPALAAPTFPALTGRVVDDAHVLTPQTQADLTAKLADLEQRTSRQLVVVTLPSLGGDDIADYGYKLLRAWGIGQKQTNNGAVFIVVPSEHKVRIEVGYGLEGVLTDAISSVILQTAVLPKFRAGDIQGGVVDGTGEIINQLAADPSTAEQKAAAAEQQRAQIESTAPGRHVNPFGGIIPLIFMFFVLSTIFRRGGLLPLLFLGSSMRGGWGGGGGFGGGGFSGGGGSGGGGGASGSW